MADKQLTAKKAFEFVLRIEALNDQIEDVYADVRSYDGDYNDNVIRDAVEARADMRTRAEDASSLINSFDWDEEGNRIGEPEESAWPEISAHLREAVHGDKKLLKVVDQIDRLHHLAVASGIAPITKADFEAELAKAESC